MTTAHTPPPRQVPLGERLTFSAAASAAYLSISPTGFRRGVRAGTIPITGLRIGGRVVWRRADLDAWVAAGCPTASDGWPPDGADSAGRAAHETVAGGQGCQVVKERRG